MKNKKKVLVIRFSSIGDIVLTTSFLNSVKKIYGSVEIHYLTLEKFSSILELQPDIDRLIILNGNSVGSEKYIFDFTLVIVFFIAYLEFSVPNTCILGSWSCISSIWMSSMQQLLQML